MKVGIYGAGVVGLTTALALQETFPNIQVTVLASDFRQATTSDGAAGLYRPSTYFSVGTEELTSKILQESFEYYSSMVLRQPSVETGVSEISGYIFSNIAQSVTRNPLIEKIVPIYRDARKCEIGKWKYGSYLRTVITECRRFLPWCEKQFLERQGVIIKTQVAELSDLTKNDFDVVFNCMGLGAQTIFNDKSLIPLRGQVVKVSAPWLKNFYYGDYDTYIIPGIDNVTLGGTRDFGNYNLQPCRHQTSSILERCTAVVPKLSTCQIQRVWVGLRPHRDPVRIQAETITVNGKKLKVIHNYGHGGYGVTTAPGSAKQAVRLFKEAHMATSKL